MSGNQVSVVIPQPNPRKIIRFGGTIGATAAAKRRKPKDSKNGSAISAVLERKNWRRARDVFMEENLQGLFRVKLFTVHESVNEFAQHEIFLIGLLQHIFNERLIAKTE